MCVCVCVWQEIVMIITCRWARVALVVYGCACIWAMSSISSLCHLHAHHPICMLIMPSTWSLCYPCLCCAIKKWWRDTSMSWGRDGGWWMDTGIWVGGCACERMWVWVWTWMYHVGMVCEQAKERDIKVVVLTCEPDQRTTSHCHHHL